MNKSITTTTRYTEGAYELEVEVTDSGPESFCLWYREDGEIHLVLQFTRADGDVASLLAAFGEMLIRADQDLRQAQ